MKKVVGRVRDFRSLVDTLLYKEPPTYLPALHWGQTEVPETVAVYCASYPDRVVTDCGLMIHPSVKYIAATPNRFVHDSKHTPSDG